MSKKDSFIHLIAFYDYTVAFKIGWGTVEYSCRWTWIWHISHWHLWDPVMPMSHCHTFLLYLKVESNYYTPISSIWICMVLIWSPPSRHNNPTFLLSSHLFFFFFLPPYISPQLWPGNWANIQIRDWKDSNYHNEKNSLTMVLSSLPRTILW